MASAQGGGGPGSDAKGGSASRVIRNPEFDARITSSGAVDADGRFKAARSKLYRGRIESAPTPGYGIQQAIYQLQFLYNPTTVEHQSGMDPQYLGIQIANSDPNARGDASAFMQISQNISFNLLFDRTYETWDKSKTSYLAQWGVLADIKVLYAMLGMFSTTDGLTITDQGKVVDPQAVQQITPGAAHQFQPVWAVFGPLLKYYGIITNFNVQYTHFTQAMVPNRCAVQIGMQLIPKNTGPALTSSQIAANAEKDYLNSTRGTSLYYTNRHVNRGLFG